MTNLETLLAADWFNPMDRHLARGLLRFAGAAAPAALGCVAFSAALLSRELASGHSCINLGELAGRNYPDGVDASGQMRCPNLVEWVKHLRQLPGLVGEPGERKPLILDERELLYLHRYWSYEQAVARDVLQRGKEMAVIPDPARLKAGLTALFPVAIPGVINWQKAAAFAAVRHRISVITGGPGTGKTWTIARVLALLLQQPGSEKLRVKLAAPTGKAAARMQESLAFSLENMNCDQSLKARLQDKDLSTTLHRLLGVIPNATEFRHNADNPLPCDVLIVDEASMIGLSMMSRLLAAFKMEGTRLILVGDKDQLPPVDPGGVFGDICRAAATNQFSQSFHDDYQQCSGETLPVAAAPCRCLPNAVVQLQVNHRVGSAQTLNMISQKVNQADADGLIKDLSGAGENGGPAVWLKLPPPNELKKSLRDMVFKFYQPVLDAKSAAEALARLGEFRILCAVREGSYGVENINRIVEEILGEKSERIPKKGNPGTYPGKPIMVTANNYNVRLFNGDIGVFWPAEKGLLVHFPDDDNQLRAIARERLPENELVYAMTIHKSQGSEFNHVLLILPDKDNPVLTRELVYTGLTRARESVQLLCNQGQLEMSVKRSAQRNSGLRHALGKTASGHDG